MHCVIKQYHLNEQIVIVMYCTQLNYNANENIKISPPQRTEVCIVVYSHGRTECEGLQSAGQVLIGMLVQYFQVLCNIPTMSLFRVNSTYKNTECLC